MEALAEVVSDALVDAVSDALGDAESDALVVGVLVATGEGEREGVLGAVAGGLCVAVPLALAVPAGEVEGAGLAVRERVGAHVLSGELVPVAEPVAAGEPELVGGLLAVDEPEPVPAGEPEGGGARLAERVADGDGGV